MFNEWRKLEVEEVCMARTYNVADRLGNGYPTATRVGDLDLGPYPSRCTWNLLVFGRCKGVLISHSRTTYVPIVVRRVGREIR
jgi:hypothetical protein